VVVALGDRWAERLREIAPGARVVTVPNGVVLPGLPQRAAVTGPSRVVFLGEIGERKGAFMLIDAWAKLAAEPEGLAGATLTMAGDREVARAEREIIERGIADSAVVRSWLSPVEVAELLAKSDVFVLPSRSEGQPMALLEAMAHGLCVVASDVGGIPEIIVDGESGLLIPADDVDALVGALRQILTDPARRRCCGPPARR
jgi:glycosyltransferase involved in cell wall biosynthesis